MIKETSKIQILQTKAWETPEELDKWQRGVAEWLNERRSKKLTTNKNKKNEKVRISKKDRN